MLKKLSIAKKIILIVVAIIIILTVIYLILSSLSYNPNRQITYGVTFSKKFANYLGLNWQEAYLAALDELKAKYIRIPTYWEDIEPEPNIYNFKDIDWQIDEAEKRDIRVILVVGRRQPRWPECHDPAWVASLTQEQERTAILDNIKTVINRYKDKKAIEIWQVENEPFLDFFGQCPHMTRQELQEEINLVKSLDKRKVLITDSGELSTWYPAIKMGDLFGSTLYRVTYNKYIGYWRYFFIPASYYRVKAYIWGKPQDATYVAELQAEPWFPGDPLSAPLSEQFRTMNVGQLKKNADYVNKTNFSRAYFWGVEWWYWLKVKQNNDSVWEEAKQYF